MSRMTAETLFSNTEKERIEAAVRAVEARTSGEIVPMVVDESYDYPRAEIVGAGFFALATATFVSWAVGHSSVWAFLPVFLLLYLPFKGLIRNLPGLKRRIIHPDEIAAEVEEKALVSFLERGLHQTRDRTGILLLISLFERRVFVLADQGINEHVAQQDWDEIVQTISEGMRSGQTADALCSAIERCGEMLVEHFPVRADDTDELPNLILN
ncbi:MAG: TPM domain-containing protein [Desulfuromonadaceae bacterium]